MLLLTVRAHPCLPFIFRSSSDWLLFLNILQYINSNLFLPSPNVAAQPRDAGADLLATMRRFGVSVPGGSAAGAGGPASKSAGASSKRDAMIVRFVGFLVLYLYFQRRGDRTVVELPCDALWPLAWPLATRVLSPAAADGFCPAGAAAAACTAETCAVSYYAFSLLSGGVFQLAIAAIVARRKRSP